MERERNVEAIKLAVRHYWQQLIKDWHLNLPGLLLPGIGTILIFYVPPLIVARVLVTFGQTAHPSLGALAPYILLLGSLWFVGEIIWRVAIHLLIKSETNGMRRLYTQAMDYLLAKDLSFFHDNFAGSLTKKASAYSRKYEDFMDTITFSVVTNLVPLPFIIFILWGYSPWLVATLLGLTLLTIALVGPLIRRRQKLVAARETASNAVAGYVADTMANMDAVRAFGREKFEAKVHKRNVGDYIAKAKRSYDYQNLRIDVVTSPLYVLVNVLGLTVSLMLSHNGIISLEAVFVSFTYYVGFTRIMWEFNRIYRNIESALSEAAQFTGLLLEQPKLSDPSRPQDFTVNDGKVEFRNVRFRYHDKAGEHLFDNFNLTVASGEKVALVGHSGGGKTTVTKLLLRFMDIESGEILIDGKNISQVKQANLRSAIAYVPQDPLMFHRSLLENIRYGRLEATDQEIKTIARLAHADKFIEKTPQGYQTLVGERGVKLSGGQRQRIAIARAMIKDAPILVLDEATSSLDSASEKLIQKALWRLMEGRTAIVIAHRLSTIQKMDRIVVLEEGKVAQEGNHKQLLEKGGIYAELWAHQSGGFLED